jgi:hypothetical protein
MDIEVTTDLDATVAQLILPDGNGELALLIAGTAAQPMVMDLLNLPAGSSIYVRVMLGEQVLQERVYDGSALAVQAQVQATSDDPTVAL